MHPFLLTCPSFECRLPECQSIFNFNTDFSPPAPSVSFHLKTRVGYKIFCRFGFPFLIMLTDLMRFPFVMDSLSTGAIHDICGCYGNHLRKAFVQIKWEKFISGPVFVYVKTTVPEILWLVVSSNVQIIVCAVLPIPDPAFRKQTGIHFLCRIEERRKTLSWSWETSVDEFYDSPLWKTKRAEHQKTIRVSFHVWGLYLNLTNSI
jgi:hypothetical protein